MGLYEMNVVVGGGPGGDNLAASNPFDEPPGPRRPPGINPSQHYLHCLAGACSLTLDIESNKSK